MSRELRAAEAPGDPGVDGRAIVSFVYYDAGGNEVSRKTLLTYEPVMSDETDARDRDAGQKGRSHGGRCR